MWILVGLLSVWTGPGAVDDCWTYVWPLTRVHMYDTTGSWSACDTLTCWIKTFWLKVALCYNLYFLRWSFKRSLFEIQSTVETSIWNLLRIYSSSCKNYVWRKPSILLSPWKIPFSRYSTLQSQMSVCPSVCQQNHSTAWNHHSSSLILHPSSFFIHPSSLFIILHSSFLHFATLKLFSFVWLRKYIKALNTKPVQNIWMKWN